MKHPAGICGLALLALLALAPSASAQVVNMVATLNGSEEVPGILTGALGSAEVGVDTAAREIAVTLRVFNLPSPATQAHIHVGGPGLAGPVVLDFPATIVGQTGDFTMVFRLGLAAFRARPANGINTLDDVIQAIVGGNAYVNVHTQANPGGEIRGLLKLAQ